MKKYGYLYEKTYEEDNVRKGFKTACAHRKTKKEVAEFLVNIEEHIKRAILELRTGTFRIEGYTTFQINENGKIRTIRKLSLYDTGVLNSVCQIVEPYIKNKLLPEVHGSVRGRGMHSAMRSIYKQIQNRKLKYGLIFDIAGFFKSIDSEISKNTIRGVFKDSKIISFFDNLIDGYPDEETPIGNRSSPMLANLYLNPVLRKLKDLKVHHLTNFVDDTFILGFSKKWLHFILGHLKDYLKEVKLRLKGNYQIFDIDKRAIDFVGWIIHRDYVLIRKRTKLKIKTVAKRLWWKIINHMELTLHDRCVVSSYYGMLKWCNGYRLYCKTLKPIVEYIKAWTKRQRYLASLSPIKQYA